MPREARYDSRDIAPAELSYAPTANPFTEGVPYISAGSNFKISHDDNLTTRPVFRLMGGSNVITAAAYPVRLWDVMTRPVNGFVYRYLIASVKLTDGSGDYALYWANTGYDNFTNGATAVNPASIWNAFTSLRNCNNSKRAHTVAVSRGVAYIRSFPSGTGKLGTIVFDANTDPTTPNIYPWGMASPATPARISGAVTLVITSTIAVGDATINASSTSSFPASGDIWIDFEKITYTGKTATTFTGCTRGVSGTDAATHDIGSVIIYRDWSAATHRVDVNNGWYYAYAYKSITGHISNRSDIERNPDLLPSYTGPFFDLIPKVTVQGDADTTNIPTIVIFRSTDGGGTFYFLEEITNTGSGAITYLDDSFGTGASSTTYADPVPDSKLDTGYIAPSLTTNSPPPTVNPPGVVGTTAISRSSYAIETYSVSYTHLTLPTNREV